jgi:hypothetical protein
MCAKWLAHLILLDLVTPVGLSFAERFIDGRIIGYDLWLNVCMCVCLYVCYVFLKAFPQKQMLSRIYTSASSVFENVPSEEKSRNLI